MTDIQVWDRVVALHSRVDFALAKGLQSRHGIGLSEYRALGRLAVADGGELRMQVLAGLICLNQSSVSRLVVRLETEGLSRRDLCPKDRRGVYTVITDKGRKLLAEAESTYEETLKQALDEAGADPELSPVVAALRAGGR